MKELQLDMQSHALWGGGTSRKYTILDDAVADAAYAKIKEAMAEYREHGNDREKTVEIDFGSGSKSTIKISVILGVTCFPIDSEDGVEISVSRARHEKIVKDRLKAEGLWEEPEAKP